MSSFRALEAFETEPTMIDLFESGHQAHVDAIKKQEQALELFARAVNKCPCAKGVERRRCTCKNYKQVAAQGGSIFKEAMYTCHCDVGRTFSKCDNVYHIQALDLQAATFEALGKLDHAMKDAEWILELAPQLPDGYLRVGKIAQLKEQDEYAWKMYTAGIEAHNASSVDSSPKLKQLYDARKPLHRLFFGKDPMSLPAELVTRIFSYLDWTEILLCLPVCKQWTNTLTSPLNGRLWRNMVFPHHGYYYKTRSSCLALLKKISSWAGDGGFRKIVIPPRLEITQTELTLLLRASPSLQHLEVDNYDDYLLPSKAICNQLRHVTIKYFDVPLDPTGAELPGQFPYGFLQNAAPCLEHLTFTGVPEQWYKSEPLIPHLPKLKYLHIGGWCNVQTPFSMFPLAIAFPRIEQLWMGPDLPNANLGPAALWRDKWEGVWPHLKVLIFDSSGAHSIEDVEGLHDSGLRHLMCLNRGNSLLHLVFIRVDLDVSNEYRDIFGHRRDEVAHSDVARHSDFRNLRSVTSDDGLWIYPDRARTLLSNSIENRQLTSFDIVFPERVSSGQLLKGYDWLRGAPSIHTLGLFCFLFPHNPENGADLRLPQFLATFPNLRTLRLNENCYYGHENELANLIRAVMSVTRLKTILICRNYRYRDSEAIIELRKEAQLKGVQISEGQDYWVEQWPVSLGP